APDGLPVALQIVAPRYEDRRVLRASRAFELVHSIRLPRRSQEGQPQCLTEQALEQQPAGTASRRNCCRKH
ncbi:MAG: hypothetical protein E5W40_22030, partial [Mesorhizobium sp.]